MNGLETYFLVTSVARDTSFMMYPLLNWPTVSFRCPMEKVFLAQKNPSNWSYWCYLVGLNCTENLNFSSEVWSSLWAFFGRLRFRFEFSNLRLLNMLGAIIFEPLMLIFEVWGQAPSVLTVTVHPSIPLASYFRAVHPLGELFSCWLFNSPSISIHLESYFVLLTV